MGYKYLDNSIEFKDVKDIGTAFGSSVLSIKNNHNYNDDETQITSINKKVLNAVEIDWNAAQVAGKTLNTTGQLNY